MTDHRVNVRFSPDGGWSTCIALDLDGSACLESWQLTAPTPRLAFTRRTADPVRTVGYPNNGGSVTMVEHRSGGLTLLPLDASGRAVGPRRTVACDGVLPGGITLTRQADSTVLTAPDGRTWHVPGAVVSGWPLAAGLLIARRDLPALLLGADGGTLEPGNDIRTVHAAAGDRVLTVQDRRPVIRPLHGQDIVLEAPTGAGRGLAVAVHPLDPVVAVHVELGATAELLEVSPDGVRPVGPRPAAVYPAAVFGRAGLWTVAGTPDHPPAYLLARDAWRSHDASAHLESFATPDGPVEAVVYGDWRTAERVVLALHGGPRDHWRFSWEPDLRQLAAHGIAVVAPNQRGSTGYGDSHERAIHGRWADPDLDDVLSIGATLCSGRPATAARPAVLGVSYGAFLALVAAAARPGLWSACAAISPFRSASGVYEVAPSGVRSLIDRLDARHDVLDELGPRDVVRLAPRITCPVLIVHGALDEVIPVAQAREIAAALPRARYLELADRGHAARTGRVDDPVAAALTSLLTGTTDDHPEGGDDRDRRPGPALAAAR